jgi:hypothetical protein
MVLSHDLQCRVPFTKPHLYKFIVQNLEQTKQSVQLYTGYCTENICLF